ncbi:sulfonate ABC transporter permease [Arcobacter sp. F155]|uniref:ABC transporter permease n=1 Tax=Arcobacter sp. F155 TaxID=2044512 RepID=UPI00100BD45C|nr:ABC transporter permease [Arcobacter sp. F155]RXJ77970.1 sulfonate ABC transporter permease [Arcobacter sp. F155]
MRNTCLGILGIFVFVIGWYILSLGYTPNQLPSPQDTYIAFLEILEDGTLFEHLIASLNRFGVGYFSGAILGMIIGLLAGRYLLVFSFFDSLVQLIRPISPVAWFPLAVLWFGIGDAPAIFIIILATFFPVLLSTISGVKHVDPLLLKVSQNFGASELKTFFSVIIPASFPHIVMGLNIGMATAWIHLVAGEMLGAQSGLGYMIVDARNFLRSDLIICGMILIGIIGWVINILMKKFEKYVNKRWGVRDV